MQDDHGTLNDTVTTRLRAAIVAGELPSGGRLVISDLVRRFEVSPMPVREAVRRLEGEGLVETFPNRGAIVREIDADLVANIYDIRAALEAMVVGQAVEHMTMHELTGLEAIQVRYEEAVAAARYEDVMEQNRAFHARINALGRNPEACRLLDRGTWLIGALRMRHGFSADRLRAANAEHKVLLAALRAGDASGAANISRMHTVAAKIDMLERISQRSRSSQRTAGWGVSE